MIIVLMRDVSGFTYIPTRWGLLTGGVGAVANRFPMGHVRPSTRRVYGRAAICTGACQGDRSQQVRTMLACPERAERPKIGPEIETRSPVLCVQGTPPIRLRGAVRHRSPRSR